MILNQNLCHLPGRHRDAVLSLMGRWQGKPSRWCSLSLTLLFVAAPVLGADEPFRFFAEAGYRNVRRTATCRSRAAASRVPPPATAPPSMTSGSTR